VDNFIEEFLVARALGLWWDRREGGWQVFAAVILLMCAWIMNWLPYVFATLFGLPMVGLGSLTASDTIRHLKWHYLRANNTARSVL
jgi:hypothetical protein